MASGLPRLRRLSILRDLLLRSPSLAPHHLLSPLPSLEPVASASAAALLRCCLRSAAGSLLRAALEEPVGEFPSAVNGRPPSRSGPIRRVPGSGQKNGNQMKCIGNRGKYFDVLWNTLDQRYINVSFNEKPNALQMRCMLIHTGQQLNVMDHDTVAPPECSGDIPSSSNGSDLKPKRKKLKGKRAVVRWLKFFRWKKKKDYERMTAEEKTLYKLKKSAQNAGIQHCSRYQFEK